MRCFIALCFLCLSIAADPARAETPKKIVGLIETVQILPEGIRITAKTDTGAENSSIDTVGWNLFQRAGNEWIKFTIRLDDKSEKTLERPLARMTKIHRAGGASQERPIIYLELCVGDVKKAVEVNLSERGKLKFRMLLGASFLDGKYLVDVSRNGLTKPACGKAGK